MRKIVFYLMLVLVTATSFSMSIGPIYFNQRIDGQGGYQEYEIDNPSFNTRRYKIKVTAENSDKALEKEMQKWVEVYPKVLTIPPKSSGKVKLLIKAGANAKPGEYKFVLSPTPITIPTLENRKNNSKLATVSLSAPIHFSLGLNSYVGNLGDVKREVKIEKTTGKGGIGIKIQNDMKREVALDILVTDKKTRWRDLIKVEKGKSFEKLYRDAKKLEIKEAPTQIELKTLY